MVRTGGICTKNPSKFPFRICLRKSPAGAGRRCRSWCRASWPAQGPSCGPADPCGAARASRPACGGAASGTGHLTPAGQHQEPQKTHVDAARASRPCPCPKRGRLYRQPARTQASQRLRHLTRSRPQDSGNEILDNGRPYGTQLSATAAAPAPAHTERAVAALDPPWALLTCLDAGGEFGRCGRVALLDATVAVRCTSGKKHQ